MDYTFEHDERLGINIPILYKDWDDYNFATQSEILFRWETIRGMIPERITDIEKIINKKQEDLTNEDSFPRSCELVSEIAELASTINDLWIWYRTTQNVSEEKVHL